MKVQLEEAQDRDEMLVAGRLVHRQHLADTLVTSGRRLGPQSFECGLQWPANHVLLGRGPGIDSALVAESLRQATIYIAHTMFDVEVGVQFLMTRLSVSVLHPHHTMSDLRRLRMSVLFDDLRQNVRGVMRFTSHVQIFDGDICIGTGSAHARLVDATSSGRLHATTPVQTTTTTPSTRSRISARQVGVLEQRLVVVRRTTNSNRYGLQSSPGDPTFFDHPLNHIPGMLLLEATRQVARHHTHFPHADFESFDLVFSAMIGLHTPTQLRVTDCSTDFLSIVIETMGLTGPATAAQLTAHLRV